MFTLVARGKRQTRQGATCSPASHKGTIPLTAASISRVLIAVGHNESNVAKWPTPKDDQSMPEAVALLKAIAGLKLKTLPAADLELRSQMQDLMLRGEIYEGQL